MEEGEENVRNPLVMAIVSDGVLAVTEGVPQLYSAVAEEKERERERSREREERRERRWRGQ